MNIQRCGLAVCFFAALSFPRGAAAAEGRPPRGSGNKTLTIPTYRTGEPEKDPIFYSGRSYQGAKGPSIPIRCWINSAT